jgi:hypothetical protein
MIAFDITGKKYSRLTAIKRVGGLRNHWLFQCECGEITSVRKAHVTSGRTRSCGCLAKELRKELFTKHGMSHTTEHNIWLSFRARCENPNHMYYKNYGGRGISVCDRWQKFENFYADMGNRPDGLTLDRINNDGNYEPSNCRWATWKQQNNNRRTPSNARSLRAETT